MLFRSRESKRRLRKIVGTPQDRSNLAEFFWAVLAMVLISFAYVALPDRYHLKPDWQEAAIHMMFATVFILVFCRYWWRKIRFWACLIVSSTIHVRIVHAWLLRVGSFGRGTGKLAVLIGFALFFALYGCVWALRRSIYGESAKPYQAG